MITGGEPFRQNITPLVKCLIAEGYEVQIETNGTLWPGDDFPWTAVTVVCSPKTPKIHPKTARKVHAYKYVLSSDSMTDLGYPQFALGLEHSDARVAEPPICFDGPVYLTPMDAGDPIKNQENLHAVARTVMRHGNRFIMGIQLHKLVRLP